MLTFSTRGDWSKTFTFLNHASNLKIRKILEKYGQKGVDALRSATPVRTGLTANSWSYEIDGGGDRWSINWTNSNTNNGVNIAFIIQAGHGTGTGGYVHGIDYINPALAPLFDEIADDAFEEVTQA